VARAERRLLAATRGLGYRRWAAACARKRIRSSAEALMKMRAIRDRLAVEAAHATLEQARTDGDAAVHAARLELAAASKALLRHGSAGVQVAGVDRAELQRLARRPRQPARRPSGGDPLNRNAAGWK
jgi:predicted amidohydrolase